MREPGLRPPAHLLAGRRAEDSACAFLRTQGLTIVARNVRLPGGEIDIVAREGEVLVFVEVRWRRSRRFGGAAASLDWRKRARMVRAAQAYLLRFRAPPACRLDALCCDGSDDQSAPSGQDDGTPVGQWHWMRGL